MARARPAAIDRAPEYFGPYRPCERCFDHLLAGYELSGGVSQAMTCAHCSAEYPRSRRGPAGKYCSDSCRVRAWEARSPAKVQAYRTRQVEKKREARRNARYLCGQCGGKFREDVPVAGEPLPRLPRYCSKLCRGRARQARYVATHGVSRQTAWRRSLSGDKLKARRKQERDGFRRWKASARAAMAGREAVEMQPQ